MTIKVDIDELRDLGAWYKNRSGALIDLYQEIKKIKKVLLEEITRKDLTEGGDRSSPFNRRSVFNLSPEAQRARDSLKSLDIIEVLNVSRHSEYPLRPTVGAVDFATVKLTELHYEALKQVKLIEKAQDPGPRNFKELLMEARRLLTGPIGDPLSWLAGLAILEAVGHGGPVHAVKAKKSLESGAWGEEAIRTDTSTLFRQVASLKANQVDIVKVNSAETPPRYIVFVRGIATITGNGINSGRDASRALTLGSSELSRAVVAAMKKEGIPQGANVMLVGHSQGGIASMNLACDPQVNSAKGKNGYVNITHVLTAGSPTDGKNPPKGTRVLSMENNADLVPDSDGKNEQSRTGRSAYHFGRRQGNPFEAHGLKESYIPEMQGEEFRNEPRVEKYFDSAQSYLGGDLHAPQRYDLRQGSDPGLPAGQPPKEPTPLDDKIPLQQGGLRLDDLERLPR